MSVPGGRSLRGKNELQGSGFQTEALVVATRRCTGSDLTDARPVETWCRCRSRGGGRRTRRWQMTRQRFVIIEIRFALTHSEIRISKANSAQRPRVRSVVFCRISSSDDAKFPGLLLAGA